MSTLQNLILQLQQCNLFTQETLLLLNQIRAHISSEDVPSLIFFQKLNLKFFQLITKCEILISAGDYKNLKQEEKKSKYKINFLIESVSSQARSKRKNIYDQCIDTILEIDLKIIKYYSFVRGSIIDQFLDNLKCQQSFQILSLFYKLTYYSNHLRQYIKSEGYYTEIVDIFEKEVARIIRASERQEKLATINENINTPMMEKDLQTKLTRFLIATYPQTYQPERPLPLSSPRKNQNVTTVQLALQKIEQPERSSLIGCVVAEQPRLQRQSQPLRAGSLEQSNQQVLIQKHGNLAGQSKIQSSAAKNFKIPPLKLPSTNIEIVGTMTRSTRRADPFKSFSTNSNRFSHSIDSAIKERFTGGSISGQNPGHVKTVDGNNSLLEDNSFVDEKDKGQKMMSSKEKLQDLATQMGGYCLTIDLPCLLLQKRRLQLDSLARLGINNIPQLVQPTMKNQAQDDLTFLQKHEHVSRKSETESRTNAKEKVRLCLAYEEETIIDSIDVQISDLYTNRDEQKNKIVKQNERCQQGKICRLLGNIIFLIANQFDQNELQFELSPIPAIYAYLSTEIHGGLRYKSLLKVLYSKKAPKYLSTEMFQERTSLLCEGEMSQNCFDQAYELMLKQLKQQQPTVSQRNSVPSRVIKDQIQPDNYYPKNMQKSAFISPLSQKKPQKDFLQKVQPDILYVTENNTVVYVENEAKDSIDDLQLKDRTSDLSQIQLDDYSLYFRLINLYAVTIETSHLKLCQHSFKTNVQEDDIDTERSIESPLTLNLPELIFPIKTIIDQKDIVINNRLFKVIQSQRENQGNLKMLDSFLYTFQKSFTHLLLKMDLSNPNYYDMQKEQLDILDGYLAYSSSRIQVPQIFDYLLDILLLIKRQMIEITNCQLQTQVGSNSMRFKTPAQSQSKSTKHYSQTITNMFRPISINFDAPKPSESSPDKRRTSSDNPVYFQHFNPAQSQLPRPQLLLKDLQSQKGIPVLGTSKQRLSMSATYINTSPQQIFVIRYPNILGLFLSILGRLMIRSFKPETTKLLVQLFLDSGAFIDLIKLYTTNIFNEICQLREKKAYKKATSNKIVGQFDLGLDEISHQTQNNFTKDQINLYINALRVLYFYESALIMLQNKNQKPEKEWKSVIRRFISNTHYLFKPVGGILTKFLEASQFLLSQLLNQQSFKEHPKVPMLTALHTQIYRKIFSLLNGYFNFDRTYNFSVSAQEDIASYYIRFCFVNFVKLYSQSNVNELKEINQKIKEYNQQDQKQTRDNKNYIDPIRNDIELNEGDRLEQYYQYYKTSFLNMYIKCLFFLACNRSEEVARKFYQYRIVEFLTREIDLEFDVTQIRDRFIKIKKQSENPSPNDSQFDNVPSDGSNRSIHKTPILIIPQQKVTKLNLESALPANQKKESSGKALNENIFYFSERRLRKIYSNRELHANIISLLITLLLTPERGTLDDHYCSQNPYLNGQPNILFLLNFHLNHAWNQDVIPIVLSRMSYIQAQPAGQRLLKLLSSSLFDASQYTDWVKIASGGYGVIYECKTGLEHPSVVAIKSTQVKKSIYESSPLYSLFAEIACLETFKLQKNIVTLYDYGVTENDYIIVMKKYPCSLKEWRSKQRGGIQENLASYLTIYRDVLQAVQMLHENNVVHYDIKADNVLLDFGNSKYGNTTEELNVVLADFGECKMFSTEENEYCQRNRGTECIKSPEMLTLTLNTKKEADQYDRRKRVGTTRTSDVWSLGCLLFEILTGEHLFLHQDWVQFYVRVTSNSEVLITEDKINLLGANIYLIDFLKYILVRDPKHRPNVENVLKRFEHVHALLITNSNPAISTFSPIGTPNHSVIMQKGSIDFILQQYHTQVFSYTSNNSFKKTEQHTPQCMRILNEIYLCTRSHYLNNQDKLIFMGITNVISDTNIISTQELKRFQYFLFSVETVSQINNSQKAIQILPYMLDYLKYVLLHRGKLLIIEQDYDHGTANTTRQALIFCLSTYFRLPVYETLQILNCQTLYLQIPQLPQMARYSEFQQGIRQHLDTYPKLQCLCGCATLILKRDYNDEKKIQMRSCKCNGKVTCINGSTSTQGCLSYLKFLRRRYKIQWDTIKWGLVGARSFLIGPFNRGQISQETKVQLALNSMGPNHNIIRSQIDETKQSNSRSFEWVLYECKYCHVWMYAHSIQTQQLIVVMNNLIKRSRQGLTGQPGIKMPVLKTLNLFELK